MQPEEIEQRTKELIDFVAALEMGSFYAKRLTALLERPRHAYLTRAFQPDPALERQIEEHAKDYVAQVRAARSEVLKLVVELLRYQRWRAPGDVK